MKKRDIVLIIGGLAFILLIIFLSLLLGDHFQTPSCGCPDMVSQYFIIIFIILAVIFVASLLYYLFSLRIDAKQNIMNKNIEVIYSILDNDEKKVIEKLINNKGVIEQNKISDIFGKIKSHRILKKLINKKLIDVEKKGKTNTIKLKKELRIQLVNSK